MKVIENFNEVYGYHHGNEVIQQITENLEEESIIVCGRRSYKTPTIVPKTDDYPEPVIWTLYPVASIKLKKYFNKVHVGVYHKTQRGVLWRLEKLAPSGWTRIAVNKTLARAAADCFLHGIRDVKVRAYKTIDGADYILALAADNMLIVAEWNAHEQKFWKSEFQHAELRSAIAAQDLSDSKVDFSKPIDEPYQL